MVHLFESRDFRVNNSTGGSVVDVEKELK